MPARRMFAVVLAVALPALAACSGGSSKSSGTPTSTTGKPSDAAADLALAKHAVLTAADLPGYATQPHDPTSDMTAAEKQQFAKCLGVSSSFFDDKPGEQVANSPDFDKNDGDTSISNSVKIEPTQALVDADWQQLTRPETPQCIEKLLQEVVSAGVGSGVTIKSSTVTTFDPGIGSRSLGYTVKFTISGPGGSLSGYIDAIDVARDRAEIEVDFENANTPFDRQQEIALARKVYDRIGNGAQ